MKIKNLLALRILIVINILSKIAEAIYFIRGFTIIEGISFFIIVCLILQDLKYPKAATFFMCAYFALRFCVLLMMSSYYGSIILDIIKSIENISYMLGGVFLLKTSYRNFGIAIIITIILILIAPLFYSITALLSQENIFILFCLISSVPSWALLHHFYFQRNKYNPDILHED